MISRLSVRGGKSFDLDHSVNRVRRREAVEFQLALVLEAEVSGALGQLFDNRGGEDLAAAGLIGDACGQDDVLSVEVGLLPDCLSGMQSDAQADRPIGVITQLTVDRALDRLGALDGAARARKHDESVALSLYLEPPRCPRFSRSPRLHPILRLWV